MMATLAFSCQCGSCYSLATFQDEKVETIAPDNTVDEWLRQHLVHGEVKDGECTMRLRLLGYRGKE